MQIRSLTAIAVVAASFVLARGQTPDAKKGDASRPAPPPNGSTRIGPARDMPFPGGVDLQYLVRELAKDLDLNVLFDPESRLDGRKVKIELRNVTGTDALNYLLLQEGLYSEEVGPRTILVASRLRGTAVPQLGVGVTPLTPQLAEYFKADGGILINNVPTSSPGEKAGLRAGDVIVGIDGEPIRGALGLIRFIDDRKGGAFTLTVVRDRREGTVRVVP